MASLFTSAPHKLMLRFKCTLALPAQVDSVLGDRAPTPEDVPLLRYTARVLCESLRMYPQPPLLIRRALQVCVSVVDERVSR